MLSGFDILHHLKNKSNILRYEDLEDYDTIESALGKYKKLVLLYPVKNSESGHWCCLFQKGNVIYFFDSYGLIPDKEETFMTNEYKAKFDPKLYRYLTKLLFESGKEIDYNQYKFQGPDTETCGYHVICRLIFSNMNANQYYKLFKSGVGVNSDHLVELFVKNIKNE
jgi:hypothetical protein